MPKKIKVLLIDDEVDFCHFVKLNLEKTQEFEVLTTSDGLKGIDLAKTSRPDLILLDILMPKMDGSDVAERLLTEKATAHIPIIFLTALVKKDELKKDTEIAGREFIAKPVTSEELIRRIKSAILYNT